MRTFIALPDAVLTPAARILLTVAGVLLPSCAPGSTGATAPGATRGAAAAARPVAGATGVEPIPDRGAPIRIVEPGYQIWARPDSAVVTVATPQGRVYTDLPLTVRAPLLPPAVRAHTAVDGDGLLVRLTDARGAALEQALVRPSAKWFTVSLTARAGAAPATAFFHDGIRGIDTATVSGGFTPDPRLPAATRLPSVSTSGWRPFAPPPLGIELRTDPGWVGIGLVEVPNATTMGIDRDGAVRIDYASRPEGTIVDLGAGPPVGDVLRYPSFVVGVAADPWSGLRIEHDALDRLGMATVASPPSARPPWWSEPFVCTWGEQVALHAERDSPRFTAAWVRQFVASWRRRHAVQAFTVIIDSRWQSSLGEVAPDPVRFGGAEGMRRLVDDLHAQGLRVLLWWPMWVHGAPRPPTDSIRPPPPGPAPIVDPTAPDFDATMARTMRDALGGGPGELNADGLKLDWTYDIPSPERLANPERASGALAIHRYLEGVHVAAHAVRADALVDGGAAAPQFAGVEDAVRLYDAWSEADWDRRATVVAAADPGLLIDGDGWEANADDVMAHAISSTVYGTPAMYFDTTWADGAPIPEDLARRVGAVLSLATLKGGGVAEPLTGGDWQYTVDGAVTARSFEGDTGIVVRPPTCTPVWRATVVSAVARRVTVPVTGGRLLSAADAAGHAVAATTATGGVVLTARAGTVYVLTLTGGC